MKFCDPNSTLTQPWQLDGLSRCFFHTVTASVLCGLVLVFGTGQLIVYRRFSTRPDSSVRPRSCFLYVLQIVLSLLVAVSGVVGLILRVTILTPHTLYVYEILSAGLFGLAWVLTLPLLRLERTRRLPTVPTRGHGLILLLFWMAAFVVENLAFVSWNSPQWWWIRKE